MMRRLALIAFLAILLNACASPADSPIETLPSSQVTRIAIASATSPATPTYTAEEARRERFLPVLLTLDDFLDGVAYGDPSLTDITTQAIASLAAFSESVGYSFAHPGSDFLGGLTGFLNDPDLIEGFDASLAEALERLLHGFAQDVLDRDEAALSEEELGLAVPIDPADMPPEAVWVSTFGYSGDRFVRLDAVGLRSGRVGVYLIYVGVPDNQPLIDLPAIASLLAERIATSQSGDF